MDWLRRRRKDESGKDQAATPAPACEHITLVARWDSVDSIGREDEVSRYRCDACGAEFSPDEGARLRATEAARLQRRLAG
jgi:transposase-like protein